MESAKETRGTKFTGNLRTKSVQLKAETPPILAPELLGSHHPSVHRLHERKAQVGLLNPKPYSAYIKHQLSIYFKALRMAQRVRKLATKPNNLNSILRTGIGGRKELTPTSHLLTSTYTSWCVHACMPTPHNK